MISSAYRLFDCLGSSLNGNLVIGVYLLEVLIACTRKGQCEIGTVCWAHGNFTTSPLLCRAEIVCLRTEVYFRGLKYLNILYLVPMHNECVYALQKRKERVKWAERDEIGGREDCTTKHSDNFLVVILKF